MVGTASLPLEQRVRQTRLATQGLVQTTPAQRAAALTAMATALEQSQALILEANQRDLAAAEAMVARGELTAAAYARLKLDAKKLAGMIAGVRDVVRLPDLVGSDQWVRLLDDGLVLRRRWCPLGVLGVIFESRPDAVTQIVSLALKTANGVLLKGGAEAIHSCTALVAVIHQALHSVGWDPQLVQLLTTREEIRELLGLEGWIDLIIPRGSNAFVRYVQENTRIPVLGHADGICHLFIDASADAEMAVKLTVDSKVQYPAACNAIETLLVHQDCAQRILPLVAAALREQGVQLRGCERSRAIVPMDAATEADWDTEYLDLILSIKIVDSLAAAIEHINTHGSRHTEAIVTEDRAAAERFCQEVDAAGVYHNASTRFADGFRYGFGAEVGISTQKLPPRGPVGIEGLVTYKYLLSGEGHIVADYAAGRPFKHQDL
ncbi:MAG: glutamate-5-semialdehyde dehydrogenase [Thermostichales cyanobacterium SZTDM-1c_bins_54]